MEQGTHNPLVLGSNPGGPTILQPYDLGFCSGHFYLSISFYEDCPYLGHKRFQELIELSKKGFDLQIWLSSISSVDGISDYLANGYWIRASEANNEEAGGNIQGEQRHTNTEQT